MQLALAETLITALENDGIEARLHENYSGRGMYGKATTGVICDSAASIIPAILNNIELFVDGEDIEDGVITSQFEEVKPFRTDSMGLDVIIY